MDFETELDLGACEPREWFVVFHRESPRRWLRWLVWGRYKHVSVFGEVKAVGGWVFLDHMVNRTRVLVVPDSQADRVLGYFSRQGLVLRMPAPIVAHDRLNLRPMFSCVSAVAHILGLGTCALRPDALLRHCLARGATIVVDDRDETAEARRGSTAEAAAGGS